MSPFTVKYTRFIGVDPFMVFKRQVVSSVVTHPSIDPVITNNILLFTV
jgi:ribulose bisphosphate carboxylase small subunit